jgi:hypothetical protein
LFQPVSLDLQDTDAILDKANRWLGRATNLKDSDDRFRLWMLIGEPRIEKLKPAYAKALNILNKDAGAKGACHRAGGAEVLRAAGPPLRGDVDLQRGRVLSQSPHPGKRLNRPEKLRLG